MGGTKIDYKGHFKVILWHKKTKFLIQYSDAIYSV